MLDTFQFRVTPDLYREVCARAKANCRRFNQELIYLIGIGLANDTEKRQERTA